MTGVTLLLAAIACILVFALRPIYGILIFMAAFLWYPTYITVPVGTIDFTLRRIVILALFAKLFIQTDLPLRLKFNWLDKFVILQFLVQILVGITNTQLSMAFIENRGGEFLDSILPYFAVRIIVQNKQQYLILLKGIFVIAAPLAILGLYECIVGVNPVGFFGKYYAWGKARSAMAPPRAGFHRAKVTFSQPIMYGMFFSMLGPVCAALLRNIRKNKNIYIIGIGLMCIGVFASVSSGPWLSALFACFFIIFYRYKKYWKVGLLLIVLMFGILEIISERHFYEEIDRVALSGETAWYRIKLIEVALFDGGMKDHWLTGYGWGVDPGWMKQIYPDRGTMTDMTNQYLSILSGFGLIGLIPFLGVLLIAMKMLIYSYKISMNDSNRWLVWCLSGGLFGAVFAIMSVALWDAPLTVFYIMIAFCGIMPRVVRERNIKYVIYNDAYKEVCLIPNYS